MKTLIKYTIDMKTVTLNNGIVMPIMGYGVWQISPEDCERLVSDALNAGYRSIDTAQAYYNEEVVGAAISKSDIPRHELFITTKVWITNAGEERAARSIDESLSKLRTDYIDLLLVHQPFGDYYGTYRAMEQAYKNGKVRAIGLSNFYDARFVDLAENMEVKPAVVQLETHVFSQQVKMRQLAAEYGTRVMAWSPLARGMNGLFDNEMLKTIARRHGKDIAQVCLKFLTGEGIIVIPQSTRPERMASNMAIDDFELTGEERDAIRSLDTGHPLAADFNDPELAKYLLNYDKQFNPANSQ